MGLKLTKEQIRDLEEDRDLEEEDIRAEEYHILTLQRAEQKHITNNLSGDAERALQSAQALPWAEFCKKWG